MFQSFSTQLKENLFDVNDQNFESTALSVFDFQYHSNKIYREYCDARKHTPSSVTSINQIPFLPIELFKNHSIKSGKWESSKIFKSSGTTGAERSHHHVRSLDFYLLSSLRTFESVFGPVSRYKILALLPSYLEQGESSLIAMVDHFINKAKKGSGYYSIHEISEQTLDKDTLVFGVTYALLDWADAFETNSRFLVVETGGMKGRRKEIIREEFHSILLNRFPNSKIYSEYGMTELMTQAYGTEGRLKFPGWAKYLIRDINDPFQYLNDNHSGGINIIDLANVDTVSFIETKDLGKTKEGFLEVLGRFDNSDIRGCNLLI